jgi:hypothetical protein
MNIPLTQRVGIIYGAGDGFRPDTSFANLPASQTGAQHPLI